MDIAIGSVMGSWFIIYVTVDTKAVYSNWAQLTVPFCPILFDFGQYSANTLGKIPSFQQPLSITGVSRRLK